MIENAILCVRELHQTFDDATYRRSRAHLPDSGRHRDTADLYSICLFLLLYESLNLDRRLSLLLSRSR